MRTQTFVNELLSRTTPRGFFGSSGVTLTEAARTLPDGADEPPRVSEDGAIAKALNYVHDARTVDAAMRFSDRYCKNCAFFIGGAHDRWARCDTFPGKAVAVRGWCSAWAPKQFPVNEGEKAHGNGFPGIDNECGGGVHRGTERDDGASPGRA